MDISKLKDEQIKLAKKVITIDSFEKLKLIAGVDFSYDKNDCTCTIVVCETDSMEAKEKVYSKAKLEFPYVKGFMTYRLAKIIMDTYLMLKHKPDIIIFPGHGISHPRRIGLASHMGISLDIPSIGVAKEILHGDKKGNIIYINKEACAEEVVTREGAKPLYISPGHKISLKTSVELIKKCMRFPHKLPEPMHLAHRYAKSLITKENFVEDGG